MRTILMLAAVAALTAATCRAEQLVYGFDDATLSGWAARTNEWWYPVVPPEVMPTLGTDSPAQGMGYATMEVQSNKQYYLFCKDPRGDVAWENFTTMMFDIRLSNPAGWNNLSFIMRSSVSNSISLGTAYQIFTSNQWQTVHFTVTSNMVYALQNAVGIMYFEIVFNQALTNTTRIDIDNFRVSNELLGGISLYDFETPTLNGWAGSKRGIASWETNTAALGTGCMRVDVTNTTGNWSNPVSKGGAWSDAAWANNSDLVVWIRASANVWSNNLRPYLVLIVGYGATNISYEVNAGGSPGYVTLDDVWHPYYYTYDPAIFTNAIALTIQYQLTTTGSPTGKYFYVDNIRLLPGNSAPDPRTNGLSVYNFETSDLNAWTNATRGVVSWTTNTAAYGAGSMKVDVTGASNGGSGNWANAAVRWGAQADAPWELNSSILLWLRASSNQWVTTLSPELSMGLSQTNLTLSAGGTATLDDKWHMYTFGYDQALVASSAVMNLSFNVAVAGGDSPTNRTVYVDNIRLMPGNVPEPALCVLALAGVWLVRRKG